MTHLHHGWDKQPDPAVRARIDELAERIERYRASYYAGKPDISDAAYDALEDELRDLDPTHPALARVGTPVSVTEWEKARHEIPMGSLNKVVNEAELEAWAARCDELVVKEGGKAISDDLFVAEKLDGISIEVIYRDGKYADAITRGDGIMGERISPNVARMRGVPQKLKEKLTLSVRGEIILKLSDMKKSFPGVANPRNAAAGTSKRFDGQGCEHLTVLFYDLADQLDVTTEEQKITFLRKQGFGTPWTAKGTLKDVLGIYRKYSSEIRAGLDYEIDGLVVRANSTAAQTLLGEVNRRPRGATAFKFASQAKVSKVVEILWDTGPSGRVTPVAIVEPVELAGATVQRASLHNVGNVRALGIGVGDEVLVSRRNDVIPYVEEVVEKGGKTEQPPTRCRRCSAELVTSGEYLLCRNQACPALVEGRIHNWIDAIGALEWGDKLIEQLVEAKLVKEPGDLYKLKPKQIADLERRGDKIAKKVLDELTSRLPLTLPVFLAALGIEGFAIQTARLLVASGYTTIEKLLAATEQDLAGISGLGPIKAGMIVRGLQGRKAEIERLIAQGIVPVTQEQEGPLAGMSFCFTGALSRPRGEMTNLVEANGGRVLSGVTKELNYLVSAEADSTSSKAQKAKKYGTVLLDEAGFFKLIQDKGVKVS
ncbi:MAG TPA: NAD-dependent DNA ligase LigA [Polyangium sp.]|nr:NAD-dependent DNA ligase LigA [Polyangium sp.]